MCLLAICMSSLENLHLGLLLIFLIGYFIYIYIYIELCELFEYVAD